MMMMIEMEPYLASKAGMAEVDLNHVRRVVEASTSAKFGGHAQKRERRVAEQTDRLRARLEALKPLELAHAQLVADTFIAELEARRDLTRCKVHIDMDAFFAAVEMRDHPRLRTVPMAVGGSAMLSTANYHARKFGVRAAMPGFIARKLCPQLEIVSGSYSSYSRESKRVRAVLEDYDPQLVMGSLDEAYLDITECLAVRLTPTILTRRRYRGPCICRLPRWSEDGGGERPGTDETVTTDKCDRCALDRETVEDRVQFGCTRTEVVEEMRFRVEQTTGLTCSAGIAATSRLAKVCTDIKKPNGQFALDNDRLVILDFLRELPVRKVSGIGAVTERLLEAIGVRTCGDFLEKRAQLTALFSESSFHFFLSVAIGTSSREVTEDDEAFGDEDTTASRKSISCEQFVIDLTTLEGIMRDLCGQLAALVARRGIRAGHNVAIKIKFATFDTITRCTSSDATVSSADDIALFAIPLLTKELGPEIRLLGVRLSKLIFADDQQPKLRVQPTLKTLFAQHQPPPSTSALTESTSTEDHGDERPSCPICNRPFTALVGESEDIVAMSDHVDECLARQTAAEIERDERRTTTIGTAAAASASSTSRPAPTKSSSATGTNQGKKRKTVESSSMDRFVIRLNKQSTD